MNGSITTLAANVFWIVTDSHGRESAPDMALVGDVEAFKHYLLRYWKERIGCKVTFISKEAYLAKHAQIARGNLTEH